MTSRPSPVPAFVAPYLAHPQLRRITLSGPTGEEIEIQRVVLRPVIVRRQRVLQVVTHHATRTVTANVPNPSADEVTAVVGLGFRHVTVELEGQILHGRVTRKGRVVTSRTVTEHRPALLAHDRPKNRMVAEDAPFLATLGLAIGGRVKPSAQAKYRQVDEFVRLLDASPFVGRLQRGDAVSLVDLGCGNAALTMAAYHHLTVTRGVDCRMVGVDRNRELVERNNQRAAALGWGSNVAFRPGEIEAFVSDVRPDVVMALHACDTASDHALAAAVRWGSELLLVAPCCHHHMHAQLTTEDVAPAERALLRYGALRERLGDVVTDAARAAILRLVGYQVDVVEFVAAHHTPKNILIRASRRDLPATADLVTAYRGLLERWGVRPLLADLLAAELLAVDLGPHLGTHPAGGDAGSGSGATQ